MADVRTIAVRTTLLMLVLLLPPTPVFAGAEECLDAVIAHDWERALSECRPVAEQGDPVGQFALGTLYYSGDGVPQDYAEALRWYHLASEQGDAAAQFSLGIMYYLGEGVPQDYVQAHMWLDLANSLGHEDAGGLRDYLANEMTPQQIAEAQRLAREWQPKN